MQVLEKTTRQATAALPRGTAAGLVSPLVILHPSFVPPTSYTSLFLQFSSNQLSPPACPLSRCVQCGRASFSILIRVRSALFEKRTLTQGGFEDEGRQCRQSNQPPVCALLLVTLILVAFPHGFPQADGGQNDDPPKSPLTESGVPPGGSGPADLRELGLAWEGLGLGWGLRPWVLVLASNGPGASHCPLAGPRGDSVSAPFPCFSDRWSPS